MYIEPADHDDFESESTLPRVDHFYDDGITASELVHLLVVEALAADPGRR